MPVVSTAASKPLTCIEGKFGVTITPNAGQQRAFDRGILRPPMDQAKSGIIARCPRTLPLLSWAVIVSAIHG